MVSGFLGKELLRKELRVRISCSPLSFFGSSKILVKRQFDLPVQKGYRFGEPSNIVAQLSKLIA